MSRFSRSGRRRPSAQTLERRDRERAAAEQWERERAHYSKRKEELTRGLVRVDSEEALRTFGLNINRSPHREVALSLSDARRGHEPVAHLFRVPGVGYYESGAPGGTWYLMPAGVADPRRRGRAARPRRRA
jgi:hypothetical protein